VIFFKTPKVKMTRGRVPSNWLNRLIEVLRGGPKRTAGLIEPVGGSIVLFLGFCYFFAKKKVKESKLKALR